MDNVITHNISVLKCSASCGKCFDMKHLLEVSWVRFLLCREGDIVPYDMLYCTTRLAVFNQMDDVRSCSRSITEQNWRTIQELMAFVTAN